MLPVWSCAWLGAFNADRTRFRRPHGRSRGCGDLCGPYDRLVLRELAVTFRASRSRGLVGDRLASIAGLVAYLLPTLSAVERVLMVAGCLAAVFWSSLRRFRTVLEVAGATISCRSVLRWVSYDAPFICVLETHPLAIGTMRSLVLTDSSGRRRRVPLNVFDDEDAVHLAVQHAATARRSM